MYVLGHAGTIKIPVLHQLLHPDREAVIELEFQNHRRNVGVEPSLRAKRAVVMRAHRLTIKRDAKLRIIRANPGFALVIHHDLRPSVNRVAKLAEAPERFVIAHVLRIEQILAPRTSAGDKTEHRVLPYRRAQFDNHVAHAAFHLKKNRRLRLVIVITQAKLAAVLVALNGRPVQLHPRRIEIETVYRVRKRHRRKGVPIALKISAHELAHAERAGFVHQVFKLVARGRQLTVARHVSPQCRTRGAYKELI